MLFDSILQYNYTLYSSFVFPVKDESYQFSEPWGGDLVCMPVAMIDINMLRNKKF
jgi:hypothetical protein